MSAGAEASYAVLDGVQVLATARSIAAMQELDGALPWTTGDRTDVWNHVEAAMALVVAGLDEEAERAYRWCATTQRTDGSWPMRLLMGEVDDASSESNMCAYLAVGLWHHWLSRSDLTLVQELWPVVRAGLDHVVGLQLPWGGIAWGREQGLDGPRPPHRDALLAGSCSIVHSLRAGVALAALVGDEQPEWELAASCLTHAVRRHRDRFLDKSRFAMDWYYPVLGTALRGPEATDLIASRWNDFVVPGLGIRCVDTNPWVTGAETCELVLCLDAVGDARAVTLLADMQHLRHESGGYVTGYVWPDEVRWPDQCTTYTAGAVVLAWDAVNRVTPGNGIMRGDGLPDLGETPAECGCDAEVSARVPAHA